MPSVIVTLAGLAPGAPLDAAVRLADALDARRVPLTLLVGPRPHPEVVAWAAARRRAGDAVGLHGTGDGLEVRAVHRLPAHEAGLRLAAALRARDAVGLEVDGFAAPGWAVSSGVRLALAAAGVDLLVDDAGVHRLDVDGTPGTSVLGPVLGAEAEATTGWRRVSATLRPASGRPTPRPATPRTTLRPGSRRTSLRHHAVTLGGTHPDQLLDAVDGDLAAGAVPDTAPGLLAPRRPTRARRELGDPELWSITA